MSVFTQCALKERHPQKEPQFKFGLQSDNIARGAIFGLIFLPEIIIGILLK